MFEILLQRFSLFHADFVLFSSIESIGARASKEWSLENALKKMKQEWSEMSFAMLPYRDTVRQGVVGWTKPVVWWTKPVVWCGGVN